MNFHQLIQKLKGVFQKKRKNLISLLDDSPVDRELKPIKVGKKVSIVELSDTELKIRGSIDAEAITVNGTTVSTEPDADTDTGATQLDELSDVSYSSGDLVISGLDTIKATETGAGTADGDDLQVEAQNGVGTNSAGGNLILEAGAQTGNSTTSSVQIKTGVKSGATGTTVRSTATVGQFSEEGLRVYNSDGSSKGEVRLMVVGDATVYATLHSTGFTTNGDITLDAGGGDVILDDDGHTFAKFSKTDSSFTLHEASVDASVDYFKIACGANGESTISTVHAFSNLGHLNIDPGGNLILNGGGIPNAIKCEDPLYIKEKANSNVDIGGYGQLWVHDDTPSTLWFTTDAGDDIQLTDGTSTAGGGGTAKETFVINARFTPLNSTTKWCGGRKNDYYKSSEIWGLSTTKVGSNYTDTGASGWATHSYTDVMVANACTVTKFTCSAYQNTADCDFIVGLWKMTPAGNTSHTSNVAVDFIGEIEFTANADTSTMHAVQSITSFESGASLSAGDCIIVAGKVGSGGVGTDRSYWWINGAIEVEYS